MTKYPKLAWESTTRVRLLHAQVSVRLHENGKVKEGEPINQVNNSFLKKKIHFTNKLLFSEIATFAHGARFLLRFSRVVSPYSGHPVLHGRSVYCALERDRVLASARPSQISSPDPPSFMDPDILQPTILRARLPTSAPQTLRRPLRALLLAHRPTTHTVCTSLFEKLDAVTWKWLRRLFDSTARFF